MQDREIPGTWPAGALGERSGQMLLMMISFLVSYNNFLKIFVWRVYNAAHTDKNDTSRDN